MYQQYITHRNRAAIVIVIDRSLSMKKLTTINTMPLSKAEAASYVANFIIDELLIRATRNHKVRNYYDVAVIGYSGNGVESLLPGSDGGFISIDRLAEYCPQPETIYIEQAMPDGESIRAPFTLHPWVRPSASGTTPMYDALVTVKDLVGAWCTHTDNRDSFPPLIFHIADGDCSDADDAALIDIAQRITKTSTRDGNTLLINVHLSSTDEVDEFCEVFPAENTFFTKEPERMMLYRMSSTIPECMEPVIKDMLHPRSKGPYRAVAFNASVCELLSIINIGSESINSIKYL